MMSTREIGTLAELRPLLRKALEDLELDVQDIVIPQLLPDLEKVDAPEQRPEYRVLEKGLFEDAYYAIHNDDLNFLKEATTVAAACYALLPDPVSVIGGLVVILFRYRRKRAKLTGHQGIVLQTLKGAPPAGWTVADLQQRLPLKHLLSASEIKSILTSLQSIIKTDGTKTAFVGEEHGLWRVIDV